MAPRSALTLLLTVGALWGATMSGCGDATPEPPARSSAAPAPDDAGAVREHYDRQFAFMAEVEDSTFLVAWFLHAAAGEDSVRRDGEGFFARGGSWERFYFERWSTPSTRVPARLLPYGALRLTVGDRDVIDGIIFDDGRRRLALALGRVEETWIDPYGHVFSVSDAEAYVADQRIDGIVVDLARAWAGRSPPPGDWAILSAGDSLRLVLASEGDPDGDGDEPYHAQILGSPTTQPGREVQVTWEGAQAFPAARRDVPISWRIVSPDGTLRGSLRSRSSHMRAGEGPGPVLPVRAVHEVEGEVEVDGARLSVRGLFVHERR